MVRSQDGVGGPVPHASHLGVPSRTQQQRVKGSLVGLPLPGYNRKKYVWKILYMYMLGYEVDFGHMEAVNLISSARYSEKSVGYAWCALMLREGDELLRLIINSIRSDLISKQDNAICLALNSICNVGGKEFAEALATDVLSLLTANMTRTYVRKKAALTTLRLYRKSPDMLPANEWAEKILVLLDEKNIGVLTSVSSLVLGILSVDTHGWESCSPKVSETRARAQLRARRRRRLQPRSSTAQRA